MNYILFDDCRQDLLPLTYTKPVAELRVGIISIREKWELMLNSTISFLTENYLQSKFELKQEDMNVWINGSILPNSSLIKEIHSLNENSCLVKGETIIAFKSSTNKIPENSILFEEEYYQIDKVWKIFSLNEIAIKNDFELLTKGRKSEQLSNTNTAFEIDRIFIEKGAVVECSILNPNGGYIYIGKNAQVMEGSIVRGSLALCENSVLKIGAKIYGATTIGPSSKVGGEVNNTVLQAYSNKGHDGFLGNSVIGEWCNLGADTNNSNLKNNYADVKLWNYSSNRFENTQLQFCGLIMGDHSKCGINTMFNTGTVVGICSNIFGAGFPRNFVPSFSWGGSAGYSTYVLNKVFDVASKVTLRRKVKFSQIDKDILSHVFELTNRYRNG